MPDLSLERHCHQRGLSRVAGVDEAGRGPLAGPVAAAAVVLPAAFSCPGLDDSKKLTAARRERLFERLTGDDSVRWSLSYAEVEEIDRINILRATHAAMARAVEGLRLEVDFCLVDGLAVPGFRWPHEGVVKGDGRSLSIAAASVIAKVSRDRRMAVHAEEFPEYGFDRHKGYGTRQHLEALQRQGPCAIHRRSFAPVAQRVLRLDG